MGLDGVELVMAFEESFGITIPDEVAEKMLTPRQVTDYIMNRLGEAGAEEDRACLNQRAFHVLRRSFMKVLLIPRKSFRPKTPLKGLLPLRNPQKPFLMNRKRGWRRLQEDSGFFFPELTRSVPCLLFMAIAAVSMLAYGLFPAAWQTENSIWIRLLFSTAVLCMVETFSRPLKRQFPKGCQTVGELIQYVSSRYSYRLGKWRREEVAGFVRQIIVEQMGTDRFTEDSRFVEDIGIG